MSSPIVQIEQGCLKGAVSKNDNDFQYYTFRGIPYAKPPVGDLRFSVTQPPDSWIGTRDATIASNICAQFDKLTNTIIGDEDCLYLNVYTPRLPSTESDLLPVMVFLHGGGFVFGHGTDDAAHGPDYLIEKDVVIVSINYRLGVLGFLCLDNKEAPGNMGLRDQVQALKWIKENIEQFGGDSKNVTIFGISAGGASVEYLLLSPMAKGLFHKAIAQSGSSLLHWAHNDNVKNLAYKIPSLNGETVSNDVELLQYLKSLSTEQLISASMMAIAADEFRGGIHFGFVPTVEKTGDWEPFLSTNPYQLLAQGKFSKVPYLCGFCTREGLLMVSHASATMDKLINAGYDFLKFLPFDINKTEITDIERKLKNIYLDGEKLFNDQDAPAIEFFTDVDFAGGAVVAANLIAKHNDPVYFYEFSYDGNLNYMKKCFNIDRVGSCHGDDGTYILRSNKLTEHPNDVDLIMRNKMTTMWTNFAKYGNPTPEINNLITTKWEPITNTKLACLVIDKTVTMKYEVYPTRMKFYEELFERK